MLSFIDKHLKLFFYTQMFSIVFSVIIDIVCIFCYQHKDYLYGFLQLPVFVFVGSVFLWMWYVVIKYAKWELWPCLLLVFPTIYLIAGMISSILVFFNDSHIWSVGIIMMFLLNVIGICYCGMAFKKNLLHFCVEES